MGARASNTNRSVRRSKKNQNHANAPMDLNKTWTADQILQASGKKKKKKKKHNIALSAQEIGLVRKYVTYEEGCPTAKKLARTILAQSGYALPGLTQDEYMAKLGNSDSWIEHSIYCENESE